MKIDFIGDIHGHADKLKELLQKLGYRKNQNTYSHPTRKVLFLGDYVDRGPKVRETLHIVKSMSDTGNAIALMGNHEYNLLCFHQQRADGTYLRERSEKNFRQVQETLEQFEDNQAELKSYLDWFKTLPLYYETKEFRAVHACWDTDNIEYLKKRLNGGRLTDSQLLQASERGSKCFQVVEETLKGKEMKLPTGKSFTDNDGTIRREIRIKWWENPELMTYESICIHPFPGLSQDQIDTEKLTSTSYYSEAEKPVFFGHYWLEDKPDLFRHNVCCLDYSVAKEGKLVAYRYDGEQELKKDKIVWV